MNPLDILYRKTRINLSKEGKSQHESAWAKYNKTTEVQDDEIETSYRKEKQDGLRSVGRMEVLWKRLLQERVLIKTYWYEATVREEPRSGRVLYSYGVRLEKW